MTIADQPDRPDAVVLPAAADRTGAEERRGLVANALLGDGSFLVTLSERGELLQLMWPHLDHDPHLGELRLAALPRDGEEGLAWLDTPEVATQQRLEDGADILETRLSTADLEVVVTDAVATDRPVLVRQVRGLAGRLGIYVRPELAGTVQAGGAYVDPTTEVLVLHRRDRVLAIGLDVPVVAGVAERARGASAASQLADGTLAGGGIAHGEVDGALATEEPHAEVTIAIAVSDDRTRAIEHVRVALESGAEAVQRSRREADAAELAHVTPILVEGAGAALDRRSQLVFARVTDATTGGVLAGPEVDPWFERSGGYGFVWPRDLAFILLAEYASGRRDLAADALRWLVRAQDHDGLWLQRSWTDGRLAPSWGTQLDETGAVLLAFDLAWEHLADGELDAELWPAMVRGADALVATLDPSTGLPAPSMDLWEERVGVHAFTAATTFAGLRAAASMAQRHEPGRAGAWEAAAARVRAGIDAHLWSEEHGRYLRSIDVARGDADGAPTPSCYDILDHPAAPVPSVTPVDTVVDVSLLGLAYPFGVVSAADPRMAATIAAVEERLTTPDGGLLRYEGDPYRGGNPWVLARLWSGLAQRGADDTRPADGVDYALAAATSTLLLPEQVDAETGAPAWVVPLTWSHAMYTLAVRPDPRGLPSAG